MAGTSPGPSTHNAAERGDSFDSGNGTHGKSNEALLKRIRTRVKYMEDGSKNTRDRGDADMQALGPDGPWDPMERAARKAQKRPCIHLDQLNQYPNTLNSQFRQAPIGSKVKPAGFGADEKSATLLGDRLRAIEFESDATSAYQIALLCAAQRGYGVITLEVEEMDWDGFDQRINIVGEPDPNAVLWDPDCRKADSSDMRDAVKLWQIPIDEFKRRWPKAEVVDCNLEDQQRAPGWINVDRQTIQVARYSYIEETERYLYLLDDGSPKGLKVFRDELPTGVRAVKGMIGSLKILKEKKAIQKCVLQCITNGLEILDRAEWPGKRVPVFPLLGRRKFIRINGVTEQVLESQIRMAIDGQRGFNSSKTNQIESANMVPKAVYMGYEGQFATSTDWENINKIATPFAEIKAIPDGAGGVLPHPARTDWNPQIEAMEIMSEAYRRAIQAAIGSHGFTIQDDTNVKSGKAVNALKQQSDTGSFDFLDNARVTVKAVLQEVANIIPIIEDNDREVGLRKEDGTQELRRINAKYKDKQGHDCEHRYKPVGSEDARHEVTVSTGPSFETQRDEASGFVEGLLENPIIGPKVADLAIKWRDLGPYGEQMAERVMLPEFASIEGQEDIPPKIKQVLGQLEAQNKELTATVQQLLQREEAKTAELESKEKIAAENSQIEKLKIASNEKIARWQIAAKGVMVAEELDSAENTRSAEMEFERQNAELAHGRELEAQQMQGQQSSELASQEHAQGLEASEVGHDQSMEQQDAQSQAALQQQSEAARLATEDGE